MAVLRCTKHNSQYLDVNGCHFCRGVQSSYCEVHLHSYDSNRGGCGACNEDREMIRKEEAGELPIHPRNQYPESTIRFRDIHGWPKKPKTEKKKK